MISKSRRDGERGETKTPVEKRRRTEKRLSQKREREKESEMRRVGEEEK